MRVTRNNVVYSLGVTEPALRVQPPCTVTLETHDAFHGQITSPEQTLAQLDFNHVNPATGPVYIEGAVPGDVLRVGISAIRVADSGVVMTAPGAGLLPDSVKGACVICPVENGHFTFKGVRLPINPMIGVIGVAPAGEPISCGTPGDHGGNMDTTGIRQGAVLRLPIFAPGALLSAGDLHAAMGDGEVCVCGLEVAGELVLELSLEKNTPLPCPLLNDGEELSFLASAATVDEALQRSASFMHDMLTQRTALNRDEALMLMSLVGQARISQVVDPLKTARLAMPVSALRQYGMKVPD